MSGSQQKRKISEVSEGKLYKIAIDITQTKNKSYIDIPLVLPQELPSKNEDESAWYGFDSKKFYPVAVYSNEGQKVGPSVVKDIRVFLTIEYFDESDQLIESTFTGNVASTTNNCYWFTALRGYSVGTYRLTFKSYKHGDIVEPYVVSIACVANPEIKAPVMSLTSYAFKTKTDPSNTKSVSTSKSGVTKTVLTGKASSSSSHPAVSSYATTGSGSTPLAIKAKIQGAVTASAALRASALLATPRSEGTAVSRIVKNEYADEEEDDEDETGKNVTNGLVLAFPSQDIIDLAVQRVDRPNIETLQLQGSVLKLSLSPYLVAALLDDKTNVSAILSASAKIPKNVKIQRNKELLEVTEKYNSPSVHDILFKLEKETKTTILGGAEIFRTLRVAFESYFEKTVLYEVEKEYDIYGKKIEYLRAQKRCLSTGFGAIFLLRFLVFLAVGIDAAEQAVGESIQSNTNDTDDTANADTHTHSSANRRRALTYKHVTGAGSKLQEIVQYILKDLEKSSHFLFQ